MYLSKQSTKHSQEGHPVTSEDVTYLDFYTKAQQKKE